MRSMRNGFSFTSSRKRILPACLDLPRCSQRGHDHRETSSGDRSARLACEQRLHRDAIALDSVGLDPAGKEKSKASPPSAARNEYSSARPVAKSLATIGPWNADDAGPVEREQQRGVVAVSDKDFGTRRQRIEVEQRQQVIGAVAAASAEDRVHVVALPHLHQSGCARCWEFRRSHPRAANATGEVSTCQPLSACNAPQPASRAEASTQLAGLTTPTVLCGAQGSSTLAGLKL